MTAKAKGHQPKAGRVSPLQSIMLILLRHKPMYGYELLKVLREEFEDVWVPQTGTVYPALKRLEERGLVLTKKRDGTEYYQLTKEGVETMEDIVGHVPGDIHFMIRYFGILDRAAKEIRGTSPLSKMSPSGFEEKGFSAMFEVDRMSPEEKLRFLRKVRERHLNKLASMQGELEELERKLEGKKGVQKE